GVGRAAPILPPRRQPQSVVSVASPTPSPGGASSPPQVEAAGKVGQNRPMDEAREIAHPAPMGTIPLDRPRKGLAAEIRGLLRTPRTLDELRRLLPLDAAD